MKYGGPTQEVSEEEDFIKWPGGWSNDILVENLVAFCPCLINLPEAKLKNYRLTALAENISKQLWCVDISVHHIYTLSKENTKCIAIVRGEKEH